MDHGSWDQKDLVEIMPPSTPRMFWFTVSSMVSPMCRLGSNLPVFFMAISFFVFFVSSSIRLAHSTAHFDIFQKFSWLCSVMAVWSFNLSPSFHFCLYKFSSIFCSSQLVLQLMLMEQQYLLSPLYMASIEGLFRWPVTAVVCLASCPVMAVFMSMRRKASMTTLPLTDWMGSITTATHLGLSCSNDCWVLISTLESQQPKLGWEWYQPTTFQLRWVCLSMSSMSF